MPDQARDFERLRRKAPENDEPYLRCSPTRIIRSDSLKSIKPGTAPLVRFCNAKWQTPMLDVVRPSISLMKKYSAVSAIKAPIEMKTELLQDCNFCDRSPLDAESSVTLTDL